MFCGHGRSGPRELYDVVAAHKGDCPSLFSAAEGRRYDVLPMFFLPEAGLTEGNVVDHRDILSIQLDIRKNRVSERSAALRVG